MLCGKLTELKDWTKVIVTDTTSPVIVSQDSQQSFQMTTQKSDSAIWVIKFNRSLMTQQQINKWNIIISDMVTVTNRWKNK